MIKSSLMKLLLTTIMLIQLNVSCNSSLSNVSFAESMNLNNDKGYEIQWKTINDLNAKGQYKSALEKVDELLILAKKEKAIDHQLKCLLYQGKLVLHLNEEGFEKYIGILEAELKNFTSPAKQILHSALGELYLQYLQNNFYRLGQRTSEPDDFTTDISLMSAQQLAEMAYDHIDASLSLDGKSKHPRISDIALILQDFNEDNRYAKLDVKSFIQARAIQLYQKTSNGYLADDQSFSMNQSEFFGDANNFVKLMLDKPVRRSSKHEMIKAYQELISYLAQVGHDDLAGEFDLKRIKYVYQNSGHAEKHKLYQKALERMSQSAKDDGAIAYELASHYVQQGNQYAHDYDQKYAGYKSMAVSVLEKVLKGDKSKPFYGKCQNLLAQIKRPSFRLQTDEVVLPKEHFAGQLEFSNTQTIHFKLVKLDQEFWNGFHLMQMDQRKNYLIHAKAQDSWVISTPYNDFNQHSAAVAIDPLEFGVYAIVYSNHENFKSDSTEVKYNIIHVSKLAYASTNENGSANLTITHRKTGKPISDVQVILTEQSRAKLLNTQKLISDADGHLRIKNKNRKSRWVTLIDGVDTLALRQTVNTYNWNEPSPNKQLYFFTDRSLYRPNQEVHFKALLLNFDHKNYPTIVKNQTVKIELFDANRKVIESAKLESKTNEYGTISGSFRIPDIGLNGQYSIRASFEKGSGYKSIQVEEYKRPKFEIKYDEITDGYKLGDVLSVKAYAKSLAGFGLSDVAYTYKVTRKSYLRPYGCYFYGRRFLNTPATIIANGEGRTIQDGLIQLDFNLDAPDAKDYLMYNFEVEITVTDKAGETQSKTKAMLASSIPAAIDLKFEEHMLYGTNQQLLLTVRNTADQIIPASGSIQVLRLKEPSVVKNASKWRQTDIWLKQFADLKNLLPTETLDSLDLKENWQVAEVVLDTIWRSTDKTLEFDLSQYPNGVYKIIGSSSIEGKKIENLGFFTVYGQQGYSAPNAKAIYHQLNQSEYSPDDALVLAFSSSIKSQYVLVEVEHHQRIIERRWLVVDDLQQFKMKINETHRGGFAIHIYYVVNNRMYNETLPIKVPWSNKKLDIEFSSIRDVLEPGAAEEWTIKVLHGGHRKSEVLLNMYDASLDLLFQANEWNSSFYPTDYARINKRAAGFGSSYAHVLQYFGHESFNEGRVVALPGLNWYNLRMNGGRNWSHAKSRKMQPMAMDSDESSSVMMAGNVVEEVQVQSTPVEQINEPKKIPFQIRENLSELVFFNPEKYTDQNGNLSFKFKMNEALTKWKFQVLAHNTELQIGYAEHEIVTRKELMILPNTPRFLRAGDQFVLAATVKSLKRKEINATASIRFFDVITDKEITSKIVTKTDQLIKLEPNGSNQVNWNLSIANDMVMPLRYEVLVNGEEHTDGERGIIPVLTNEKLVTKSIPFYANPGDKKEINLADALANIDWKRLQSVTIESTSNPIWYAIQALPYIAENKYESTTHLVERYFANELGLHVMEQYPEVKQMFAQWKKEKTPLKSNLQKNEDLKTVSLVETPWVKAAESEEQRKADLVKFFEQPKMRKELAVLASKIAQRQNSDGGFRWMEGSKSNVHLSQSVLLKFSKLQSLLGAQLKFSNLDQMINKAVRYIDQEFIKYHEGHKNDQSINHVNLQYLLVRSYHAEIIGNAKQQEYFAKSMEQVKNSWLKYSLQQQSMIAQTLSNLNDPKLSELLVSFEERAIQNQELGAHWNTNPGYHWYEAPIGLHADMIQLFNGQSKYDNLVASLKKWLIKNKQTNHWGSSTSTSQAVFALMISDQKSTQVVKEQLANPSQLKLTVDGKSVLLDTQESGVIYSKKKFEPKDVKNWNVLQMNNDAGSIAWGSVYLQYFDDMSSLEASNALPVVIKKEILKKDVRDKQEVLIPLNDGAYLKVGDQLVSKVTIRVDRTIDYMHLSDMRGAGLEPTNVISKYKWQNGLGYYETTKDEASHFFFEHMPRGTYIFEYSSRVSNRGVYSMGNATLQSMYAPEFLAFTEGKKLEVK